MGGNIPIKPRLRAIENCERDLAIAQEALERFGDTASVEWVADTEQEIVYLNRRIQAYKRQVESQRERNRARSRQQGDKRKKRLAIERAEDLAARRAADRAILEQHEGDAFRRPAMTRAHALRERLERYLEAFDKNPAFYEWQIERARKELRDLQERWGDDVGRLT